MNCSSLRLMLSTLFSLLSQETTEALWLSPNLLFFLFLTNECVLVVGDRRVLKEEIIYISCTTVAGTNGLSVYTRLSQIPSSTRLLRLNLWLLVKAR